MGVTPLVADKLVNHIEKTVGAVYDRHPYEAEKKEAMERWHFRLKEIIEGRAGELDTEIGKLQNKFNKGQLSSAFEAVKLSLKQRTNPQNGLSYLSCKCGNKETMLTS